MKTVIFFKKLWALILLPFSYLEYGTLPEKIGASAFMAITFSPVVWAMSLIHKYFFHDRDFVEIIFVLLIIDIATGLMKHLKTHTFSWSELFLGMIEKVFVSAIAMVTFNALGSIKDLEKNETIMLYFTLIGKLLNAFYVGGSAFNNLYIITGGKFPPVGWMKRMKDFNLSGNVEDLTNGKRAEELEKDDKKI